MRSHQRNAASRPHPPASLAGLRPARRGVRGAQFRRRLRNRVGPRKPCQSRERCSSRGPPCPAVHPASPSGRGLRTTPFVALEKKNQLPRIGALRVSVCLSACLPHTRTSTCTCLAGAEPGWLCAPPPPGTLRRSRKPHVERRLDLGLWFPRTPSRVASLGCRPSGFNLEVAGVRGLLTSLELQRHAQRPAGKWSGDRASVKLPSQGTAWALREGASLAASDSHPPRG